MSFPRISTMEQGIDLLFPELSSLQRRRLQEIILDSLRRIIQEEWGAAYARADPRDIRERMKEELKKNLVSMGVKNPEIIAERFSRALNADELARAVGEWFYFKDRYDRAALHGLVDSFWNDRFYTNLEKMNKALERIKSNLDRMNEVLPKGELPEAGTPEVKAEEKKEETAEKTEKQEPKGREFSIEEIESKIENVEKKKKELERIFEDPDILSKSEKELKEKIRECINGLENALDDLMKSEKDLMEKIRKRIRELENALDNLMKPSSSDKELKESDKEKELKELKELYEELESDFRVLEMFWKSLKDKKDEDIKRICDISKKIIEEVRKALQSSLITEEALKDLVVDVMNRMLRKDLSLYIVSQLKRNPLEELYLRLKKGEEI